MSELGDRRARKKARTRESIRSVAHRMFADEGFADVTIADIARVADVAVQTVFNHFASKEELFFDGRTPWVAGPAEAVRSRAADVPPLTALREYVVATIEHVTAAHIEADHRRYIATIQASDSLKAYERELVHQTEVRLRDALIEAWSESEAPGTPVNPVMAAALVAASWLSSARTLVVTQRPLLTDGADPRQRAAEVVAQADHLFRYFEQGVPIVHGNAPDAARPDTGRPVDVRRAG